MTIKAIIEAVITAEGGYVDHANDPGGATKYGITEAVARANGYTGKMKDLTKAFAYSVYYKRYVQVPRFDALQFAGDALVHELVDTGVNMGPAVAAMFLQRALNALHGSSLFVDGRLGAMTIDTLRAYLNDRPKDGLDNLVTTLNALQATRYIELVERNSKLRTFINGWLKRVGL